MRRLINSLGVLALLCSFINCQADSKMAADVPQWILSAIGDSKTTSVNTDFSSILADKRVDYMGFIGADYHNLKIEFQKVLRKSDSLYDVTGISIVKKNRCHFHGIIDVIDNREFANPTYGVDDSMRRMFKRRGCSIAKYKFEENPYETGSGTFSGYLLFFWYESNNNRIIYDDIDDYSDSYCNNLYAGIWKSYTTKKSKPCAWGQYRIPTSGDLDIGASEFSVNPKYLHNGWENDEILGQLYFWIGSYEATITYGTESIKDSIPGADIASINYNITIEKDACIVTCAGFQSYYSIECSIAEVNSNSISLKFKRLLEGDTYIEHYEMPFLTIYKDKQNFYVKSPYITDKDGKDNKFIPLRRDE